MINETCLSEGWGISPEQGEDKRMFSSSGAEMIYYMDGGRIEYCTYDWVKDDTTHYVPAEEYPWLKIALISKL